MEFFKLRHCCQGCYPFTLNTKTTASQPVKIVDICDEGVLLYQLPRNQVPYQKGPIMSDFCLFCRLTITISSSTNTRLLTISNGTGSRNPHKTHKTPLQNCSAAGFHCSCLETAEKALFQAAFGHRKVRRNSIKITVDLC